MAPSHKPQRRGGDYSSDASDRFYQGGGSLSDSLRRGDAKYAPNGEVRGGNTIANREYSRKMHKSYSTRDVYGGGGGGYGASYRGTEPLVEFPPTLPQGQWAPPPPPHHGGGGGGTIVKSRSYADWDESRNGPFGGPRYKHGEDMARLETELRDAHLMRLPNGNMHEMEHHHRRSLPATRSMTGRYSWAKTESGGSPRRLPVRPMDAVTASIVHSLATGTSKEGFARVQLQVRDPAISASTSDYARQSPSDSTTTTVTSDGLKTRHIGLA